MRTPSVLLFLVGVVLATGGCDRLLPEDPEAQNELVEPGVTPGTFEAEAGSLSGGGYEQMEGEASFEVRSVGGASVFVIRLRATNIAGPDTSVLAFGLTRAAPPAEGGYAFGDAGDPGVDRAEAFVAAYRSVAFAGAVLRSASGTLTVTGSGSGRVAGHFELTAFERLQIGPDTFVRRPIDVAGTFHAVRGPTGTAPDVLFGEGP